ncbi:MAG: hypothetical protein ABL967_08005 [Bryobacteraceae bacterium]
MIKHIESQKLTSIATPEGSVRRIIDPSEDKTRLEVSRFEVEPGKSFHANASADRTQVVYILDGKDARVTYNGTTHDAQRRCGVYLEPGEEATLKAAGSALSLLFVSVPKHTGKAVTGTPAGYYFEEAKLRALIDESRLRTRTFWVNKETGLSGSWDLQIGRMIYGPKGCSPRHVHMASKTSSITPEHFYFIETGIGEVRHDSGSIPVGPGSMVLIPAGDWHSLNSSDSGFDYIEFQAPFDFATTMDNDPLGKNWYILGTDDGTGKLKLWVQS